MEKIFSKIKFPIVLGMVAAGPVSWLMMNGLGFQNWKLFSHLAPNYAWIWWQSLIYVALYFFVIYCVTTLLRISQLSTKK